MGAGQALRQAALLRRPELAAASPPGGYSSQSLGAQARACAACKWAKCHGVDSAARRSHPCLHPCFPAPPLRRIIAEQGEVPLVNVRLEHILSKWYGEDEQRLAGGCLLVSCAASALPRHALQWAGMLPARDQFLARKGDKQRTAGRAARRAAPAWHASRHAHGRPASSEGRADRTLWPPATRIRAALLRAASGTRTHTARARMGGEPVGVLQAGATHR